MPPRTYDELAAEVLEDINDPEGNHTSKKQIKRYFDEAQLRIAEETNAIIARVPITVKENQSTYNFPEDMLLPIRLEDKYGVEIVPTTAKQLETVQGSSFRHRTQTGTPTKYYSDYAGKGKFEFNVRPSPSIETGPLLFSGFISQKLKLSEDLIRAKVVRDKLYILLSETIEIYTIRSNKLDLDRIITHNKSALSSSLMTVYDGASAGVTNKIFFSVGAVIYNITTADVVQTFLTRSNFITWLGDMFSGRSLLYFLETDGKLYWSQLNGGAAGHLVTVVNPAVFYGTVSYRIAQDDEMDYIGAGLDGLIKIRGSKIVKTYTLITTNTVKWVTRNQGVTYYADETDRVIYTLSDDGVSVSTGIKIYDTVAFNTYINAARGELLDLQINNYINIKRYQLPDYNFIGTYQSLDLFENVAAGWHEIYNSESITIVYNYAPTALSLGYLEDSGCVANIDDFEFTSDYGIITDIEDDTDIINFDSDFGVVVAAYIDDDQYYLIYSRKPTKGVVEIGSERCLQEYAKYKAKMKNSNAQSQRQAALHFREYENLLGNIDANVANGFNRNSEGVAAYSY